MLSHAEEVPSVAWVGGGQDIDKGVTERFSFDGLRISQIQRNLSKTKQRKRLMG